MTLHDGPAEPPRGRRDVLIVAHGSPDARHARDVAALTVRIQSLTSGRAVATAYLDHHAPDPLEAVADLTGSVVLVPLLLAPAYHVRVDVPEVAVKVAEQIAPRPVALAGALGPHPLLLQAVAALLADARVDPHPSTAVLLCGAGSSDGAAARMLDETLHGDGQPQGWGCWAAAVLDGGPTIADVATTLTATHRRVVAVSVMIADGVLRDRMFAQADEAGVPMVPGALAQTDALAELVLLRADRAGDPPA